MLLPHPPRALQELASVREQLDQAKQEKLAALMRAAELQGQNGGGERGAPPSASQRGRTDSAKSDGSPVKPPAAGKLQEKQRTPASSPPAKRTGGWWGGSPVKDGPS